MAALLAALQGGAANVEQEDDETPVKAKGKGNAAKANTVNVPTTIVTDDDGVRWRFTQVYQSAPKNAAPTKYRTPRILIERKTQTDGEFAKLGHTLTGEEMAAIRAIPEAKVAALTTDARES